MVYLVLRIFSNFFFPLLSNVILGPLWFVWKTIEIFLDSNPIEKFPMKTFETNRLILLYFWNSYGMDYPIQILKET